MTLNSKGFSENWPKFMTGCGAKSAVQGNGVCVFSPRTLPCTTDLGPHPVSHTHTHTFLKGAFDWLDRWFAPCRRFESLDEHLSPAIYSHDLPGSA